MIRVLVVEDHHLVREGICALLDRAHDIEVVGEAATGEEALLKTKDLAPDIVLTDIAMPRMDGVQAIELIRQLPSAPSLVVLSMYSDAALVRRVLRAGASGYVLKSSVGEELLLAIRAASRGQFFVSPGVTRVLVEDSARQASLEEADPLVERLTNRQREVLQLIAEGHTSLDIAELLHVGLRTVERDRAALMEAFGTEGVSTLLRAAVRRRLVFPESIPDFDLISG